MKTVRRMWAPLFHLRTGCCAPRPCLQELIPPTLPIISVSKGIEVTTGQLMSEVIPSVLGKKQPTVYLSGGHRRGTPLCVFAGRDRLGSMHSPAAQPCDDAMQPAAHSAPAPGCLHVQHLLRL